MIEKLYHTESYTEPVSSIIKKVNEVITAINSGTQPASDNSAMQQAEDIAGNCGNAKCPDYRHGYPGNCEWRSGRWNKCVNYKPATSA